MATAPLHTLSPSFSWHGSTASWGHGSGGERGTQERGLGGTEATKGGRGKGRWGLGKDVGLGWGKGTGNHGKEKGGETGNHGKEGKEGK